MSRPDPDELMHYIPHFEVMVVVFSLHNSQLHVLLVNDSIAHAEIGWILPSKSVLFDQSLETTASNCLASYIGAHETYLEQLYTYGEVDTSSHRCISVVYFAIVPAESYSIIGENVTSAYWSLIINLPDLSQGHLQIIQYALRRLRYKLEYTAVGFELLPVYFTLSELQHTYELILGEKLDKRNFRRRILEAGVIEATNQSRMGEGRPARLYRYQPDAVAEVKARRLFP
jgi:8-oxo-dGTP diphosphatase